MIVALPGALPLGAGGGLRSLIVALPGALPLGAGGGLQSLIVALPGELPLVSSEPCYEIMVFFILRKLVLQTRMRSHPVGLEF